MTEYRIFETEQFEKDLKYLARAGRKTARANLEHRCRQRLLADLLDQLDTQHGAVDEALVEKYARLLA